MKDQYTTVRRAKTGSKRKENAFFESLKMAGDLGLFISLWILAVQVLKAFGVSG